MEGRDERYTCELSELCELSTAPYPLFRFPRLFRTLARNEPP